MAKRVAKGRNGGTPEPKWVGLEASASYAELISINVGERGFMLTFGQVQPEVGQINVVSKVVLPPKTAGELLPLLIKQIGVFEERYGRITPDGVQPTTTDENE